MTITKKKGKEVIEIAKKKRHLHLIAKLQEGKSLAKSELKELEIFEQGGVKTGCVENREKVAAAFGVSKRQVERWVKIENFPVMPDGTYNLLHIKQWHENRKKKKPVDISEESIEYWELQVKKATAQLKQTELARLKGQLISADEVEQGRVQRVISLKNSFLGLGRSLAALLEGLEPTEIQAHIDDRVTYILNEYAGGNIKDFPNDI